MNKKKLDVLHNSFNLVLAGDYQMAKLVPYWDQSPQPGSTYYLQKPSHSIFCIVIHATNESAVYLFDGKVGPKNTDHTISYPSHYISQLPDWMRRVHLFYLCNKQELIHNGVGTRDGAAKQAGFLTDIFFDCRSHKI